MSNLQKFRNDVYKIVAQIPSGKVMSYGQIAAMSGRPRSARQVGQIAHFGPEDLPWHRVVKKDGGLASGFPGGMRFQRKLLDEEGVEFIELYQVNMTTMLYSPTW